MGKEVKSWKTGDRIQKRRPITEAEVEAFASLVGDRNPIHSDLEAARSAGFDAPIAHGMIAGSLFSEILGNDLPGPGSIYLEQSFKFLAPIYIGTEVDLIVEVVDVRPDQKVIRVSTNCTDMSGRLCLTGEATLLRRGSPAPK